jgi:thiosulfate/3-mercaptopyruvate sulfurtransferase
MSLITPAELAQRSDCLAFDCRFSLMDKTAGRLSYEAGHIPGARFADLEQDLSSPGGVRGRHPLPERASLESRFRAWGVNDDTPLVCYDQNSGAFAARFWWLARWLGHRDVAVLEGGLDAWLAAGLPTNADSVATTAGHFTAHEPLTRMRDATEIDASAQTLLDARDIQRFRGEVEPIDRIAGRIPGAISAPFTDNLVDGRFKSAEALRLRFSELGLKATDDIVCYCGSGVTAAHNVLALIRAGYPEPALYPGSWSEWIEDPARPIERG